MSLIIINLDLSNLPTHTYLQADWPVSLQDFLAKCESFSLLRDPPTHVTEGAVPIERGVARGMTPKKLHEVCRKSAI